MTFGIRHWTWAVIEPPGVLPYARLQWETHPDEPFQAPFLGERGGGIGTVCRDRPHLALANLTITPERQKLVDFSIPVFTGVNEVVVTSPSAQPVETVEDLSGKEVVVRASSSYYESLQSLNSRFAEEGIAPIDVTLADEHLEVEDLLEMVNADLIPRTLVDSYLADFWSQVFPDISVHEDVAVAEGGQIACSPAGAIGVMQLLPSTAADPNVDIADIEVLAHNIHAGAKYLGFLRDRYFSGEELDELNQLLFSLAAYNAGPGRVARLRRDAAEGGLDRNQWFDNVEVVAAKRIGRETVQYVSNIFKYHIAYERIVAQREQKGRVPSGQRKKGA